MVFLKNPFAYIGRRVIDQLTGAVAEAFAAAVLANAEAPNAGPPVRVARASAKPATGLRFARAAARRQPSPDQRSGTELRPWPRQTGLTLPAPAVPHAPWPRPC